MDLNRRVFLKSGSLAIVGTLLPLDAVSMIYPQKYNATIQVTIPELLRSASILRKSGDLINAKLKYDEIIALNALEIRAYDGMRNILLQSKHNELEVLNLYNSAYTLYPNEAAFKQRLAKEYSRLCLGHKKFASQVNINNLLGRAKELLADLTSQFPLNQQYPKQLEAIERKINMSADIFDARANTPLKELRKQNRHLFKDRFSLLPTIKIKGMLDELLLKSNHDLRNPHVRELYKAYIKRLKAEKEYEMAASYSKELYLFDIKDTASLKLARLTCRKDKKFSVLEPVERDNDTRKNSFWSKIALFDAIYGKILYENNGLISELSNLLNAAAAKKFTFYHNFEFRTRQVKLLILQDNFQSAFNSLNAFADTLIGTTSDHFINKFNLLCVHYFQQKGDMNGALKVLSLALKEDIGKINDPFFKKLALVNRDKENKKPIHNKRLGNYRAWIVNNS